MISFYIIKKHCEKMHYCENCVFANPDSPEDTTLCLLECEPSKWPIMQLQKAYDELWKEDETAQVFYKQVADRMLDVMGINKKEGDTDAAD